MSFTVECIPAGASHSVNNSTGRTAVLRVDSAGQNLDLLDKFEGGVLPRTAVDQAVRCHAVDEELVLGAACSIGLDSTLERATIDRRSQNCERLEASGFRKVIELFRVDVVRACYA